MRRTSVLLVVLIALTWFTSAGAAMSQPEISVVNPEGEAISVNLMIGGRSLSDVSSMPKPQPGQPPQNYTVYRRDCDGTVVITDKESPQEDDDCEFAAFGVVTVTSDTTQITINQAMQTAEAQQDPGVAGAPPADGWSVTPFAGGSYDIFRFDHTSIT